MVNVLHVFILLMCCVFNNSQNIGLLNLNYLNYEVEDIKLVDEAICPKPQPCYSPLKYDVNYRCGSDVTCPLGLKCCRGDCFIHKVCVQPYHVNKLQVLELPTAENVSLLKTIVFDISNETLLNNVKVHLSENLKNIFANETGKDIFDAPESLISLATILPFLKNSTHLKETVKEYNQSSDEIFELKPLTKNYESTEKSINADVVNNDIINIDDSTVKNNLISGDLSATTIHTTDAEKDKKSVYSFLFKKAKHTIYKGLKSATLQHIKGTKSNIGGLEDDSDYFEGSGHSDTVSTTPDNVKKEFDGSGDYNIQIDEQSKYKETSSNEETDSPSSVITFTETNYINKESDSSVASSQKLDEQIKFEEVPGNKEETRTTPSIVSSTSKEKENNGYSKTHHRSPFKNIKSAVIKIKNLNRALKTSKNHFEGFEDDVDYFEGSGTDENVVGSGNFHKQNENKNISNLVQLVKNNRLFRHAAHYWKQFRRIGDDNEVEGSGSGEGVTLSSQANISDGTSTIASSTDNNESTLLVSSSTHQVREHKQFIGLEDDYYYDLQEDEMTTITNQIPFITISSTSTTTVSLENSKINEDFIDIDGDSSTLDSISTIQDAHPKTSLEGSGSGDDEIISSGDYDYEGSGAFEESENVSTETSRIPDDKTLSPISDNPTQTTAVVNVVKEYTINVISSVIATSSESGKEYVLPEKNNPTINQKEIQEESSVANDIKAALDMMRKNTSIPNATEAGSESIEQHVLPEKNYESATNSILKAAKINEKEIQKESSVANDILRKYKEDKFETPNHDKAISAAKAALDMMKESTGFEPDEYYEDDS